MDQEKINTVEAECNRLLQRIEALNAAKERQRQEQEEYQKRHPDARMYKGDFPRESGAVRRASLDLTRALADMRRRG